MFLCAWRQQGCQRRGGTCTQGEGRSVFSLEKTVQYWCFCSFLHQLYITFLVTTFPCLSSLGPPLHSLITSSPRVCIWTQQSVPFFIISFASLYPLSYGRLQLSIRRRACWKLCSVVDWNQINFHNVKHIINETHLCTKYRIPLVCELAIHRMLK